MVYQIMVFHDNLCIDSGEIKMAVIGKITEDYRS